MTFISTMIFLIYRHGKCFYVAKDYRNGRHQVIWLRMELEDTLQKPHKLMLGKDFQGSFQFQLKIDISVLSITP